ncbi:MAG TPA: hypothetical protein VG962_03945 [Steroidobacteraceae bacterium]|nr:hypothetical protein [Steroidobacteraceae bacterium]
MKSRILVFLALSICGVSGVLYADQSGAKFPTLCRSDEFAYLNAKMSTYVWDDQHQPGKPAYTLKKNGKLLSLCADRDAEPLRKLTYRYGEVGKNEFEYTATEKHKFYISYEQDGPHGGSNVLFFHVGEFTYYVTEATGDGHGIGIQVFKEGARISNLFSGTSHGVDYVSGLFAINFNMPSSPIFAESDPENDIWHFR